MSLVLQSSGGGSITINEPTTASNFTQTLPASNGSLVIQNGSNNLLMNSGYGSDATAYGCRAWVNFNGTGTVAIRASGNVSSITDNGTGDYTVNFTTAIVDANYSTVLQTSNQTSGIPICMYDASTYSTTQVRIYTRTSGGTAIDNNITSVAIFR